MTDGEKKDLEEDFTRRVETLASFYDTGSDELSEREKKSLTPILNSLHDNVSRYREIEQIAEGGEKRVILTHDHQLDRRVAMARAVRDESPAELEQFLREARLTANLAHPNIMPVYNMGLDEAEMPFFTMELIPGDGLKAIVKKLRAGDEAYRREYPIESLLEVFIKVCDAIAYAHSRDVLHLDIKPDNIQVGEFGEVIVCDWGLARVTSAPEGDGGTDSESLDGDVLNDMTLSGTLKGTPGFMAPEQTEAYGEKTTRTDVYALGALLYNLLTYELPVAGKSANEVIQNTRAGKIIPPRRRRPDRRVPRSLVAVMMKALSLNPADRYQNVLALRREVSRYLSGHPTRAERAGWITKTSLLLQRHSRVSFLLIFFLLLLAFVIFGNLLAINREKSEAVAARITAEENFRLYKKERKITKQLGEGLGEAVLFTVKSRDFVNAPSMISLLETGLAKNIDTVKRQHLYEQKGVLHFVLQEFNAANDSFETAGGKTKRISQLRKLSLRYARAKPVDKKLLADGLLADMIDEAQVEPMLLYYLYYHHIRRRHHTRTPWDYAPLASAMLDKLNRVQPNSDQPLKLSKTKEGFHLDLSGDQRYVEFAIDIVGVYQSNVLAPLNLVSVDISGTRVSNLSGLKGIQTPTLNIAGIELDNPYALLWQVRMLGVKQLILKKTDFPENLIRDLGAYVEVVDVATLKAAAE